MYADLLAISYHTLSEYIEIRLNIPKKGVVDTLSGGYEAIKRTFSRYITTSLALPY